MPRKRVASTPPDDDSEPFEARRLRSRTIAKPKAPKPQAVAAQKRASPGKKSTVRPSRQGIDTRSRRRKYEIAQKQVSFHFGDCSSSSEPVCALVLSYFCQFHGELDRNPSIQRAQSKYRSWRSTTGKSVKKNGRFGYF
jgi:hypothetical protein